MRWKTTLALLVIVIGVGAYVSLYELKQPTPERRDALARQVVRIDADQITKLEIQTPTVTAVLEGAGEAWRLTSPITARADSWFVQRVLATLDPLEADRILSGTVKPADCGLEPPRGTLKVTAGGAATTLLFGDQTAVGKHVYLTLPESPTVFIVDAAFFDHLNQSLDAYRARELLPFETWKVTQVALTAPKASFTLAKSGDAWRLTESFDSAQDSALSDGERAEPIADEADSAEVADLLNDLKALRIERFLADQPTPEQLGWLEPPYAKVTLTVEGLAAPLELVIGKPTTDAGTPAGGRGGSPIGEAGGATDNEEQRVAKRADEPALYAVTSASADDLLKEPQDLRSKQPESFKPSQPAPAATNSTPLTP
ncbi:MAG: DUF4340 domain-containing protein [Candidatus Omnitrophica bacterium]|nr:DUF4340 domain-containing protein [Candidatus Omnitrophota bacterium]